MKYLIFLTFFFFSCSRAGPIEQEILRKSDKCKDSIHGCVFSLADITAFEWDSLYLFQQETSAILIESAVKFPYHGNGVPQDKTRMLFTFRNKIVHQEDFDWGKIGNRILSFIEMPIDTTSDTTAEGCYTRYFPSIGKSMAVYKLYNESNPRAKSTFFFKNHEVIINLFLANSDKCFESR